MGGIFMYNYIICSVITFSAESAISASKQCYHPATQNDGNCNAVIERSSCELKYQTENCNAEL